MELQKRLAALIAWGNALEAISADEQEDLSWRAANQNPWFTPASVQKALEGVRYYLEEGQLEPWAARYALSSPAPALKIGLVLAGNIPMVGFHDLLCVLLSGHQAVAKLSSQDQQLLPWLVNTLLAPISPELAGKVTFVERLQEIDAVIATGSDNSARYFDYYFGKYPHIIRKNRSSAAIINGQETTADLETLGHDLLDYFGLGCRNVSKIYVPQGYQMPTLLDGLAPFASSINHHKYANNYDYHKSIFLVNQETHLDTGFMLFRESETLVSPISVVHYAYYDSPDQLSQQLATIGDKLQITVSQGGWFPGSLPFGESQKPAVWDYADGVDTLRFLTGLEQHVKR